MIEHRDGDLLEQEDLDFILHQCNCFCTMGAGIAKAIANRWPEVAKIDALTGWGDQSKLGDFTVIRVSFKLAVVNLYGQYRYGQGKHTDYDALRKALKKFIDAYGLHTALTVGVPYGMGCGLAGGDWKVVGDMLSELFGDSKEFKLVICRKG